VVVDVYAFVANCTQCPRNRVGKRHKTNYLKTFRPTEPLLDLCLDLLGPLPQTAAGDEHLLVIVVVAPARTADGARPRQKTQHRMWSDTKEK